MNNHFHATNRKSAPGWCSKSHHLQSAISRLRNQCQNDRITPNLPSTESQKATSHSQDVPEDENMSIASEKWHDDWLRDADSVEDSCRVALTQSDVGVVVQSVVCSHQQTPHPYRFAGTAQRWLVKFSQLFSCGGHRHFEHSGGSRPCKERKHCT